MTFIARFLFALMLTFAVAAHAAAPLIFKQAGKDLREQSVLKFLQEHHGFNPAIPFKVATTDLNNDGVGEWVVRQDIPGCQRTASCPFYITGLKQKKPALLGQIAARKIGITDEKSYGVTTLVVYNDQSNDFTYKSFSWEPSKGSFVLR